jgi:hypothetical protein
MIKLRPITLVLFLLAIGLYIFSPPLGLGIAGLGVVFELAGWLSHFKDHRKSKEKET